MSVRDAIERRAIQAIEEKVFPGCVIGLISCSAKASQDKRRLEQMIVPVGTIDGKVPTQENTICDLASITKSIPLASLALLLVSLDPPRLIEE